MDQRLLDAVSMLADVVYRMQLDSYNSGSKEAIERWNIAATALDLVNQLQAETSKA